MRQTTIYEFINDLQALAEHYEEQEKEQEERDQAQAAINDFYEQQTAKPSPIETMISGFIANMTEAGKIPTLEQTQSIILLDSLVSKYRG